ncbi:MAG: nucleotide exchange factor GrpE [Coriobacteriales bacterium]|jgi:molecular chaperone GrpE|nr:nucleotide exchange factor GrpE [Coriobacteriales bacterium]
MTRKQKTDSEEINEFLAEQVDETGAEFLGDRDALESSGADEVGGVGEGEQPNESETAELENEPENALESAEPLDEPLDELAMAQTTARDLQDRYVRLQAEWDNFRKRTTLERQAERGRAAGHLVERLLPIVDDLERAIEHSDTASEDALKEGIQAVYAKLEELLKKEGVAVLNPVGEAFDANVHSAVGTVEDASLDEDTVCEVYQKGYEMAGKLLRPATVVVSKK